jgi:hypothetical protein
MEGLKRLALKFACFTVPLLSATHEHAQAGTDRELIINFRLIFVPPCITIMDEGIYAVIRQKLNGITHERNWRDTLKYLFQLNLFPLICHSFFLPGESLP